MSGPHSEPFHAVRRRRRARASARFTVGTMLVVGVFALAWLLPVRAGAQPTAAPSPGVTSSAPPTPTAPSHQSTVSPPALASPVSPIPDSSPSAPVASALDIGDPSGSAPVTMPVGRTASVPAATSSRFSVAPPPVPQRGDRYIRIDTTGYQTEIDQCLWVRMDLEGAAAPIVGAHNVCGGDVVLGLASGDRVYLTGQGLDGLFVVTDSRDVHVGDLAAEATAGLVATVILQTCYWDGGRMRLVALMPADAMSPDAAR